MRHIEKLKKVLKTCGRKCPSANTNGKALNKIVELAESGVLVGSDTEKANLLAILKYKSENF